jgi:hypothetical protein
MKLQSGFIKPHRKAEFGGVKPFTRDKNERVKSTGDFLRFRNGKSEEFGF